MTKYLTELKSATFKLKMLTESTTATLKLDDQPYDVSFTQTILACDEVGFVSCSRCKDFAIFEVGVEITKITDRNDLKVPLNSEIAAALKALITEGRRSLTACFACGEKLANSDHVLAATFAALVEKIQTQNGQQ
ncbi:MAG: hypothetical protein V1936_05250 [Patescibacteria group bacterium]